MSSLGVAAGVALVLAAGLVVVQLARRRRRAARPAGPRTVAELVRLREDTAGQAAEQGSSADDTTRPVAAGETGAASTEVDGPAVDEVKVDTVGAGVGAAAIPSTSSAGSSGDTPWARARLLGGAQDTTVEAESPSTPEAAGNRQPAGGAVSAGAPDLVVAPTIDAAPAVGPPTAPLEPVAQPEPTAEQDPVAEQEPVAEQDLVGPVTTDESTGQDGPSNLRSAAEPEQDPVAPDEPAAEADPHGADRGRPRVLRLVTPPRDADAVVIPAQRPPVTASVPTQRGPVDAGPALAAAAPAAGDGAAAHRPSAGDESVIALSGVDDAARDADGEPGPAHLVRFQVLRRGGSAVGGACVSLLDGHGREIAGGYADTQGCGELRAPRPARYLLVSSAPHHQPGAVAVSTVDGDVEAEVSLPRSASVRGSVRGVRGPIVGARLTLAADGETVDAVASGSDGGYRLRDLAEGTYRLSVDAVGCRSTVVPLEVADGAQLQRDVDLEPVHRAVPTEPEVNEPEVERLMIGNG